MTGSPDVWRNLSHDRRPPIYFAHMANFLMATRRRTALRAIKGDAPSTLVQILSQTFFAVVCFLLFEYCKSFVSDMLRRLESTSRWYWKYFDGICSTQSRDTSSGRRIRYQTVFHTETVILREEESKLLEGSGKMPLSPWRAMYKSRQCSFGFF